MIIVCGISMSYPCIEWEDSGKRLSEHEGLISPTTAKSNRPMGITQILKMVHRDLFPINIADSLIFVALKTMPSLKPLFKSLQFYSVKLFILKENKNLPVILQA